MVGNPNSRTGIRKMKQHELELAIQRVRELHKPIQLSPEWGDHCEHCDQDFPCATIKALDGETK